MNKQILSLPLDLVVVGARLRPVDEDYVALLADSMVEHGQQTPITVGPAGPDGRHKLIAGGHRMAAAVVAGLKAIDAIVSDATGLDAELLEIDENLMRRELSALDRAVFLARRKDVYEALNPDTKHGGKRDKGKSTSLSTRFSAATAAKLGVDERTIQRAVARAKI
ncbi:MAG: ParB N-terminal domain-containing protein, partial [Roseomonas sp.]|nr:ParB N-terminal domain-containing protein [Roseomonas sp.]